MKWLVFAFVTIPALELYLLIQIGTTFGALNTFFFIILTGIIGASLARIQGLAVLKDIQKTMAKGQMPAQALIEGACVLFCGALLLTPGIVTDIFGVLTMMPFCRRPIAKKLQTYFQNRVAQGTVNFSTSNVVIDMEPTSSDDQPQSPVTLLER